MGCCSIKNPIEETDINIEKFFDITKKNLKINVCIDNCSSGNDQSKNNFLNIIKEIDITKYNIHSSIPEISIFSEFTNTIINEFNKARINPGLYAEKIYNLIKYIKFKHTKYILKIPGRVKTTLFKGEASFKIAINHLKSIQPLPPLIRENNLKVIFQDTNNIDFTKDSIRDYIIITKHRVLTQFPNISIFPDVINDAEISAIIQIVDETFQGVRRNKILSSEYKNIEISCGSNKEIKLISFTSLA